MVVFLIQVSSLSGSSFEGYVNVALPGNAIQSCLCWEHWGTLVKFTVKQLLHVS